MLLVPIGPLAFVLAPISVAVRGRRRLAIQGSADPLHNIARGFRVRRNCAQRNNRTSGQYSNSNHCDPPSAAEYSSTNMAARTCLPDGILLRLDGVRVLERPATKGLSLAVSPLREELGNDQFDVFWSTA